MSFSSEVKQELAKQSGKSRHCQIAELAALVAFDGKRQQLIGDAGDVLDSENPLLQEKYGLLLAQLFHVNIEEIDTLPLERILETIKMWNQSLRCADITETVNGILLQQTCCRRAYIRGAFLAGGSISDPNKSYHFEIVCASMGKAQQIQKIMRCFALDAKIVSRKKSFVVYLKEGAQIVDVLNVMEAHQSLMELENIRILKDMRNTVNRKVNCETANINKTVSAAVKQIDDIRYIEETKGLDKLPEGLKDMALTRLTYPEASLKELGALLQNPVGKSGVNHRLRKLSEMAEEIRAKQGGTL